MKYPVKKIAISQGYHAGKSLDFGWTKAEEKNQDIISCDKGTIYRVEKQPKGGNVIYIKHDKGIISAYGHLKSVVVKVGQSVELGQKIGTMGSTGVSTGEHLHFGLYSKGKNIYGNADLDPFKYLEVYSDEIVYDVSLNRKYADKIKYHKETIWTVGDYKLLYDKALRKTHSLGLNNVKVKECSALVKKHLTSTKPNDNAVLKKGTEIKIKAIYDEKGRIWGQFGNSWLVLCNVDGTPQATKIG